MNAMNTSDEIEITTREMCYFCFDVLYNQLHSLDPPTSPRFTNDPYALFVTWRIGQDRLLRGCKGTFNPLPLHAGLREYALISACKDARFQPLTAEDLTRAEVSVSLLFNFEERKDFKDWKIGFHGVKIEFKDQKGNDRTAAYLPEVPARQFWDHEQTLKYLLRKSGYYGNLDDQILKNLKLIRFQTQKLTIDYQEYLKVWRNQKC